MILFGDFYRKQVIWPVPGNHVPHLNFLGTLREVQDRAPGPTSLAEPAAPVTFELSGFPMWRTLFAKMQSSEVDFP